MNTYYWLDKFVVKNLIVAAAAAVVNIFTKCETESGFCDLLTFSKSLDILNYTLRHALWSHFFRNFKKLRPIFFLFNARQTS